MTTSNVRQFAQRRLGREADHAEVRLVHTQQHRRLRADRRLVVAGARAVRRPHLAQPRARSLEHVRNAEAVADLDQLAARHQHVPALGERGEREQDRGRVVVHDERGLRARQAAQDAGDVILPRAAAAGGHVVLQVRVAARDLAHAVERSLGERRAPEVRVHDHAGGVDDPSQPRCTRGAELGQQLRPEIPRIVTPL